MTATVSTNTNGGKKEKRISPARHNWKQNIWGDRKLFIVLSILHLIAAPAVILAMIISIYGGNDIDGAEPYLVIGCITTGLAGFLGIFPAVNSFSYLHDKSVVDMKLSLPMNARQRFLSDYFSGLFTYIVPFLGAQVFSLLFTVYGLIFMDGKTIERTEYYWSEAQQCNIPSAVPYVCDRFSELAPALLKLILCGVLVMVMLYTVAVLITVCCGSKFESISYTILINALVPLTVICVTLSIFDTLYGVSPYAAMYKIISYTSPAGGVIAAVDWVTDGEISGGNVNFGVWAVVYLLITAAIGTLAYFLYGKRRAEQVSKPFVFKLAYYITVTCAMFCLVSLFIVEEPIGLIPVIIITAIVYMIFEVVTNRGFKRFWVSIIKYAVTFLAAYGLIWVGERTGGFGLESRVPSAASVVSVELMRSGYEGAYDTFTYAMCYSNVRNDDHKDYFEASRDPIVLKDKENIGIILDAHKAEVDFVKRCDKDGTDIHYSAAKNANLMIRYHLTGGRTMERCYDYYDPATADILSKLDLTEEYKSQIAEKYRVIISEIPKVYEKEMEYNSEHKTEGDIYKKARKYKAYTRTQLLGDDLTEISVDSLCRRGFYEQLAEAYAKDIMAINEENYYYSDLHNVWTLYPTGDMDFASTRIVVPESFANTVELLEYFDFNLRRIENVSDEEIISSVLSYSSMSWGLGVFTADEFRSINMIDGSLKILPGIYRPGEYGECYVYDFGKDVCDVVRSSLPMHIADENGYIISIYGNSAAIPAELWDTAKRIPRSARNEAIEELYYETVQGESDDEKYSY